MVDVLVVVREVPEEGPRVGALCHCGFSAQCLDERGLHDGSSTLVAQQGALVLGLPGPRRVLTKTAPVAVKTGEQPDAAQGYLLDALLVLRDEFPEDGAALPRSDPDPLHEPVKAEDYPDLRLLQEREVAGVGAIPRRRSGLWE